jgi:glucosamine--fructose-6-phosphate aminotransferase (isomerizing)
MSLFHGIGKKISSDRQIKKYAFVGSGSYYGLAREAQLKIKEMVLLPSDSYISLDYQHGPMSNVDKNMLVTVMVSDSGLKYDIELAANMKSLGGKVFTICDRNGEKFKNVSDYMIELNTGLGDGVRDILYMPALQYMAYYKSISRGYDPDNPKNLSYHVELANESA